MNDQSEEMAGSVVRAVSRAEIAVSEIPESEELMCQSRSESDSVSGSYLVDN